MNGFIESEELVRLAAQGNIVDGATQSLAEVLAEQPQQLVAVGAPSLRPLSLTTYKVRLERSEAGEGPRTYGLADFVAALANLVEPASAIVVEGQDSTYVLLLDAGLTRVVTSTSIDPPIGSCERCESPN